MKLCAKGTDIVTDVQLAENYWKICLSPSSRKTCIERFTNVLGREERKQQAMDQSQVLHGVNLHTSKLTHATLYIHEEAKEGSLISSSFVLYLIFENRVFSSTQHLLFLLRLSSRELSGHTFLFSAEGFWHIHPCSLFTWMLGIQTRSSCLASVLTHWVSSLAVPFSLTYINNVLNSVLSK